MSRVKAFAEVSNEHRSVSLGGRRRNRSVRAWLNTDNETEHDCGMTCAAQVNSHEISCFHVELPEQYDGYCQVEIVGGTSEYALQERLSDTGPARMLLLQKEVEKLSPVEIMGFNLRELVLARLWLTKQGIEPDLTLLQDFVTEAPEKDDCRRAVLRH